eukprot:COSAG02_NODE_39474_length_416_cov_7.151420_1_plen_76_part_01
MLQQVVTVRRAEEAPVDRQLQIFSNHLRHHFQLANVALRYFARCDGTELDRLDQPARYPQPRQRMSAALGPSPIAS